MIKNNETKEENTTINTILPIQQDSYNIQMMGAVDRDPQVFSSLNPIRQADLTCDLQKTYGNQYVQRLIKSQNNYEKTNETPLQTKKENTNNTIEPKNETALPDGLKENVEKLSGLSLDDVRVHYNSSKPEELDALAYTQGTDIYVASGQEKHLPHETWHAVQQKQGRVQPTMQFHGININDNEELEREADVIGEKSIKMASKSNDMKESFESIPDSSFENVPVHYNSDKLEKFQTLTYTKHNDVYIAPRQKKHLGNEVTPVVQQQNRIVTKIIQKQDNNDFTLDISPDFMRKIMDEPIEKRLFSPITPFSKEYYETYKEMKRREFIEKNNLPEFACPDWGPINDSKEGCIPKPLKIPSFNVRALKLTPFLKGLKLSEDEEIDKYRRGKEEIYNYLASGKFKPYFGFALGLGLNF